MPLENSLQTHDIAVPLVPHQNGRFHRAIILTQSCTTQSHKAGTLSRVQHFEALGGGTDSSIIFVQMPASSQQCCQQALQAFQDVQFLLLSNSIYIPVLYVASPEALPSAIKTLTSPVSSIPEPNLPLAATCVLPYCTDEFPMKAETLTALSDIFPNMRSVASLQREEDTSILVAAGMCEAEAEDCVEFWKAEYLAE